MRYIILAILLVSSFLYGEQITNKIHFNGYSSFEFEYLLNDGGMGDKNASFDADLFDLVFNIHPTEKLRIATDLTWEHGSATEDDLGNVAVEYAFPEYTIFNWLKIRAGKMFCNFGIYNEIHTAKPAFLTVKEPFSTNKNDKLGSDIRFYPRWVNGIAVLGELPIPDVSMDYILQVSNGNQENTNQYEEDDNIQKAIGGRTRLNLIDLQVGASFYTDWVSMESGLTNLLTYGAHLIYCFNEFELEGEYVQGYLGEKWRHAFTGMLSYNIGGFEIKSLDLEFDFVPYARYEYLDPNENVDDDIAMMYVYGVNVQIDEGFFWKIDFNTMSAQDNNPKFVDDDKIQTELKSALVVGF